MSEDQAIVPQPTFGKVNVPSRVVSASAAEENGEDDDDDDDDDDFLVGIVVVEGGPAKASTTPTADTRTEAATAATATATAMAMAERLSGERILFLFFLSSELYYLWGLQLLISVASTTSYRTLDA